MRYWMLMAMMACAPAVFAAFTLDDSGKALTLLENGKPVFVYHYALVEAPQGVPEKFRRAGYLHPLYGLDGEIMTQDFPADHRHHRGVFWAWPNSTLGDKTIDVWALEGVRQVHEKWLAKEAGDAKAEIAVQNAWVFDEAPNDPKIRETVRITALPASETARAIDFDITVENVSKEVFILAGAKTANKGYGGFCFRPDATRLPMHFTDARGAQSEDQLRAETPWADVSFPMVKGDAKQSGVAIFQHPANPGYPHPGWIMRHYGFLGASWPHTEPHTLNPGESFHLRYRLLVHRGSAEEAKVKDAFQAYQSAQK